MATHVVVRPFPGPGGERFAPGTEVDASNWRTTAQLVRRRYLRPIAHPEAGVPTARPIAGQNRKG